MKTRTIRIGGMTCIHCQNRIEQKLQNTVGIRDATVSFTRGTADITYNEEVIDFAQIKAAIEALGYQMPEGKEQKPAPEIIGTLVIILALYALLRGLGVSSVTSAFPLAETGMSWGMLFVIGLVTSVHCLAMCGGINVSQTLNIKKEEGGSLPPRSGLAAFGVKSSASPLSGGHPRNAPALSLSILLPAILYNSGRVISYTITGIIVGALGSVITVSGRFQGLVQLIAGVFMVIMGINMLGLFPALRRFNIRLPNLFAKKINEQKSANKSPLIIGLFNGLMPCGPLQAMQLYALSTGSPIAGGIAMFLFSMGTVPLMFGLGALGSFLSSGAQGRVFTRRVMKAGAVLVTVMGMTMFTYGWALNGLPRPIDALAAFAPRPSVGIPAKSGGPAPEGAFQPVLKNGVQIINSALEPGRYPAITVQQGIPVKWTIKAPPGSINGCNNRMIIREYNIEHHFMPGDNVIEFMPERAGRFSYSCWMGMIRSSITVVAAGESIAGVKEPSTAPTPAGVAISTEHIALAEITGAFQTVSITLRDEGIEPAILVVQRDIPVMWTINNNSLDAGNSLIIVPAYYTRLDIDQGDNVIEFMPQKDFDFSTGDNVFYGYVKVVDDINSIDINAVKEEAAAFETMIYPDAYFDAVSQGGSCCGRGA
jgi:sulfite exporter TauE/SafE/copper chaperone CopZ/plastocyanin domain-containing protein